MNYNSKKNDLIWQIKNELIESDLTPEQMQILEVFENDPDKEMQPRDIVKMVGKEGTNIRPTVTKLLTSGYLKQENYGKYKLATIN